MSRIDLLLADHEKFAADVEQGRLFAILDDEALVADRLGDLLGDGFLQDLRLGRGRLLLAGLADAGTLAVAVEDVQLQRERPGALCPAGSI